MSKKEHPMRDEIKRYEEMASNPDIPIKEVLTTYASETKQEFANAKDLTKAKQERKEAVAKRLNALREENGKKQKEVATAIGVNVITLSGYEVGRSEPNAEVLVRLADLYGVSLDYILCRTDTKVTFDKAEYQSRDEERREMAKRLVQLEEELSTIKTAIK